MVPHCPSIWPGDATNAPTQALLLLDATVDRRRNPKASQMKFRFLALGLVVTLAGVASAQVFKPLPEPRVLPRSTERSQPPATTAVSQVPTPNVRSIIVSDSTRSPVPVHFSTRRPFVPPAEPAGASSPPDADMPPPGKMTESAAKAAIEADGYKGVRALARGPDGAWKASAWRGQTEVQLSVDPTGNVSAN
jgi:hypothetical protein